MRFTVRRLMIAVAVVAAGLALFLEFSEGLPPRFVVGRIPARIAQLRPGMTRAETYETLGVNRSWLWGGLSATFGGGVSMGMVDNESYYVRAPRFVAMQDGQGRAQRFSQSSGLIQLRFRQAPDSPWGNPAAPLIGASFGGDGHTIARMPERR